MKRIVRFFVIFMALSPAWLETGRGLAQPPPPPVRNQEVPVAQLGEPIATTQPKDEVLPPPGQIRMMPPQTSGEAPVAKLKSPALEPTDVPLPINLAAALKLADARPLIVAAAQASAWVAEAQLARAKVLWLPTMNFGFDQYRHDGYGPDFNHGVNTAAKPLNQNINFTYAGGGFTNTTPGVDMLFEPLAARQTLKGTRWNIQAAKNDALFGTAAAYFEIHRYRGKLAGATDVVERGKLLVKRITDLSKDLVPKVEIDRSLNALADFEQQAVSAREQWRVQSAHLTQILRLDPRTVVVPLEQDHLQITLIDPHRSLDELIPIGLTNRPELAGQQAFVQAVLVRIRKEKLRPLVPSILLNGFQTPNEYLQFGAQGMGSDGKLNLWSFRDDFSIQPLWQAEGLGLGNLARVKEQRAMQSQAIVELFRIQDGVAGDVTRAQARLQSSAVRTLQAERALREALITYDGNYEGLRQTRVEGNILVQVYRPQEAVVALEHLRTAYDQYFMTIADYNRSQFELFHALGYPASDIAAMRPPGDPLPVDLNRPDFLPPVKDGPPPATR